jgi:hypothetical protein
MSQLTSWWDWYVGTGTLGEEKILKRGTSLLLKPPPLLHRNEHCCIGASLRNDLRPVFQTSVQQCTETSLRMLHRPAAHDFLAF